MPRNKREGLLLSVSMSLIMICVMAALNDAVKLGTMTGDSWVLALERLPLGFLFGIVCDLCICAPLSLRLARGLSKKWPLVEKSA